MSSVNPQSLYESFLTSREIAIREKLDPRLKSLVLAVLLGSSETANINMARFIFKIIDENKDLETAITEFFLTTLRDYETPSCLEKFESLRSASEISNFFHFVALKKWHKAQLAIDSFHAQKKIIGEGRSDDFAIISNKQDFFNKECLPRELGIFALSYLVALPESQRLSVSYYKAAFFILERSTILTVNEKKTLIKMIVAITSGVDTATQGYSKADLEELIEEMTQVSQLYGDELFEAFCVSCIQKPIFLDEAIRIIKLLNSLSSETEIFSIIERFVGSIIKKEFLIARQTLTKDIEDSAQWIGVEAVKKERDLTALLSRFSSMGFPLESEHLAKIASQYQIVQDFCEKNLTLRMSELVQKAAVIRSKPAIHEGDLLELIAIARLAIRIKFGIYLHHTQILTVLGQLLFSTGCIAQVKTGEGKSMIVCVMAFVNAMQKKSVHIISSSSNLAIRDKNKFENFFKSFGLITSDVCEQPEPVKFKADILYGTASDFEFAVMREMLYQTPLFLQPKVGSSLKRFDCVIIDEVDNLTIDTGLNGARLSAPAEVTYDWVYPLVFKFMQLHCVEGDESILSSKLEVLKKFLYAEMSGRFASLVPTVTDDNLKQWLESAYHVLFKLKKDIDYVIQRDKALIVDVANTGRIMHGSRWSKGIHEFVEVKHGLPVQQESINPISLSHPVYYQMYRSVFGLTGTLGSKSEREEIRTIYHVHSFDVPTYHVTIRDDQPPRMFASVRKHQEAILGEINRCRAARRPILVLCESIQESIGLHAILNGLHIEHEVLNEVQEKAEDDILEKAGFPGAVTIATNTAGRGTDIILKGESRKNGGLQVLLTSFPASLRVEEQARGRAARQGDPGSSAMFVCAENLFKGKTFNEKLMLGQLFEKRQTTATLMKDVHIQQANIDRFRYSLVAQFFEKLIHFRAQAEEIINRLSHQLASKRILDQTVPNFAALSKKDLIIAKDVHSFLCSTATEAELFISWKACLYKLIQRIEQRIINDWSINFYSQTDELISRSTITRYSQIQEIFQLISPELSAGMEVSMASAFAEIQTQVRSTFQLKSLIWDKYLDPKGEGVSHYLNEIRKGRPILID